MFVRIRLLFFSLVVLTPLTTFAADVDTWDFRVFLDDKEIGAHRFDLVADGDVRTLTSTAQFNVKFLFVTAYKYDHKAVESWDGDCLSSLQSRTDDNGTVQQLLAKQIAGQTLVESRRGTQRLGQCVMTFAYWNPLMLAQSRLLNSQNGEYVDVTITELGNESVTVRGAPTSTRRYALRSTAPGTEPMAIDLWYSRENEWVALESRVEGGRRLIYRLK